MKKTLLLTATILFFGFTATATPYKGEKQHKGGKHPKTVVHPKGMVQKGLRSITEDAARAHVYFLADDLLEGRQAGRRGSRLASLYIVSQMRQLGISPLSDNGYLQPFEACAKPLLHRMPRYYVEADSVAKIKSREHCRLSLSNVLGMIPGRKSDEYVVVGAHFDHEGMNPELDGDNIYNGADDNASGVSAVLQIMKAFVESGAKPERTVIFAFWDGEEYGLLGSRFFVENFSGTDKVKSYLNFDMVGGNNRADDPSYFVYFFTASHPEYGEWLRRDIAENGFRLNPNYKSWDNPVGGSDQGSFARKGIPVVWYHTDAQPHYNHPSDEAPTVNYQKLADISRASFLTAWHLANE